MCCFDAFMKLKGLTAYLLALLGYVAVFFVSRLVFLLVFSQGGHAAGDIIKAFFVGARIDLSLAATFISGAVFFAVLAGFWRPLETFLLKPVVRIYLCIFNLLLFLLLLADFPFYTEYSCRLNHLFFEYFDKPKELFVTIAGIRHVIPLAVVFVCFSWVIVWGTWKLCGKMFDYLREEGMLPRGGSALVIIALSVIFIRGGFQRRPLNWGAAFFSTDNFMNQMALNGVYNLFQDVQIFLEERSLNVQEKQYFATPQEALETANRLERYADEKTLDSNTALSIPKGTRPNVVIFFMESFAAKYVGALGAKPSLTPEFDKLTKEGIFFTSFYGNGTRTSRGLAAGLNSFPPMAGVNMSKKIDAQQSIPNVAHYLDQSGYDTMFFYGGDRNFEGMAAFALTNGFKNFYDCSDYTNLRYHNPIGVYDEEMFENIDRMLRTRKAPFFAAVMTLTNHGPFIIPPDFKQWPGLSRERQAFVYSDYAIGKFIAMARKSPYYKNTIFIIQADHAAFIPDFGADRFHTPLLFLSPLFKKPAVDDRVASQLDLPMTILHLCGIALKNTDTPFWGLSLAERKDKGRMFFLDDPYFGVITKDAMYRESFSGQGYMYNLDGTPSGKTPPRDMVDYAHAIKQGSSSLFFARKAGSLWKKGLSAKPAN